MPLLSFISGHKPSTAYRRHTNTPSEVQTSSRIGSYGISGSGSSKRVGGSGPGPSHGSQTRSNSKSASLPIPIAQSHGSSSSLASSATSFNSTASKNEITSYGIGIGSATTKNVANEVPLQKELNSNNASLGQEWMKIDDSSDDDSECSDGVTFTNAHHEPFRQNLPHDSKLSKKASQESIILVEEPDSAMFQLKQQLKAAQISLSEAQNQCATLNDRIQVQEEKIKSQETLLAAATLSWNSDKISTTRVYAIEMENKDKEIIEVKKELEVALLDSKAKAKMIEELTLDSRALEVEINHVRNVVAGRDKEIIGMRNKLKEVKSELVHSNELWEKLVEEKSGLVEENNDLRTQIESLQAIVNERDADITRMRHDEAERTKLAVVLNAENNTLCRRLELVKAEVQERDINIARMRQDETERTKHIAIIDEEKETLRRQLDSVQAIVEQRNAEIVKRQEEDTERAKHIALLDEEKEELRRKLERLKRKLAQKNTSV